MPLWIGFSEKRYDIQMQIYLADIFNHFQYKNQWNTCWNMKEWKKRTAEPVVILKFKPTAYLRKPDPFSFQEQLQI